MLAEPSPGPSEHDAARTRAAALWALVLDRFRDYLRWTGRPPASQPAWEDQDDNPG
jgi:hypothetical protein